MMELTRKRVKVRRNGMGVSRIVRDSYTSFKATWYEVRKRVLQRDGYRCRGTRLLNGFPVRCSHTHETHTLEVHHILPLSRGGKTIDANLITLCTHCHDARHAHLNRH